MFVFCFVYRQTRACEEIRSLVDSEICIRDKRISKSASEESDFFHVRAHPTAETASLRGGLEEPVSGLVGRVGGPPRPVRFPLGLWRTVLGTNSRSPLYTSDAAHE